MRLTGEVLAAGDTVGGIAKLAQGTIHTASALSELGSSGTERTVVLGRNMADRIIPYAEKHGYDYYGGTPRWVPFRNQRLDLWFNKRWINSEMRGGSRVVDIGETPGMPPSVFYDMERSQVDGYWNYVQDPQP